MSAMSKTPLTPLIRTLAALALIAATLGLALSAGASAQSVADIELRDQLIANQENLLNAYRCMFDTDTALVAGGCADPVDVTPGPAPPEPTSADIEARDQLIAAQEDLLNVYRCQFNVDTQLVPGGCPDQSSDELTVPWDDAFRAGYLQLYDLMDGCRWDGTFFDCLDPSIENQITELVADLYSCTNDFTRANIEASLEQPHAQSTFILQDQPDPGHGLISVDIYCFRSEDPPLLPIMYVTTTNIAPMTRFDWSATPACPYDNGRWWYTVHRAERTRTTGTSASSFICYHPDYPFDGAG